ncbi:inovirus Gp2 family protein [Shewanella gelidimarina]|uniref:YagK/YfjJ domain-containing protein n=1 Tax=Shewanella gelidimarina TaxID=56813 RepID=UPI00200DA1F2|nr:inovirus-type Gp2 protein [Shewanella gelidimarina]MCL1056823.1 inovirus Gp2 family protein [Shewanella gelidimarina]
MLKSMMGQLFNMLSHHNKLHALRFDLHQAKYQPDNKRITRFNRNLFKRLKRKYGVKRIGYFWVREQETAPAPHYHCVLFLDGSKVDYPNLVLRYIREVWLNMSGSYFVPKHCFYNFHRSDDARIRKVIYRISYLAKGRGKGNRPPQTKDSSPSRIKQKVP